MRAVLMHLDMQSGATFAVVVYKGADDYALGVVHESWKFTGRSRITILSDQEKSVKTRASMPRDSRLEETMLLNTRRLQRQRRRLCALQPRSGEAAPHPEVQIRGGAQAAINSCVLPSLARHAAWQINHSFPGEE